MFTSPFSHVQLPENLSFPDYFLGETEIYKNEVALMTSFESSHQLTFSDVSLITKKLTAGFQKLGINKGDIVGICLLNCPQWLPVCLAIQRLGATITACNPAYTYEETLHQLSDTNPICLITQTVFMDDLIHLVNHIPNLRHLISIDRATHGEQTLADILNMASDQTDGFELPKINPKRDLAFILYSSGTTGLSKGTMMSHFALVSNCILYLNARGGPEVSKLSTTDRVFSTFPLFHAGGIIMLLVTLLQGSSVVLLPKFEIENFFKTIENHKITQTVVVPPILVFLAKSPIIENYNLTSLKSIVVGAAPAPKEVIIGVRERLKLNYIVQLYGMTELCVVSHLTPIDAKSQSKFGSTGVVMPNMQCKVVDYVTFKEKPVNEEGEIWIRSPSVMNGYFHNSQATKATVTSDGWLRTGDIGYCDKDGYLYVSDRLKELIKVRGYQVAPAELENIILSHPSVADVAVVGVPDEYSGESPRAYVVLKQGKTATEDDIKNCLTGRVIKYKHLTGGVIFVEELPKTGSGKLLRRKLRDQAYKEAKMKSKI